MLAYQGGNSSSFEELYRRHSGRVYGFLKQQLRQPGEAEDLLQQVFLRVHQHRTSYDPTLPFLTWLFSITRHLVIDHVRKRRAVAMDDAKLTAIADSNLLPPMETERTSWDEVMALLPIDQRRLIELRFQEGMSFDEIAARSQLSPQSTRKRVSRVIQNLRNAFGVRKGGKS